MAISRKLTDCRSFMSHRPRRQSSIAKSSESSKEIFAEAKKLYQRELKAKKDSEQKVCKLRAYPNSIRLSRCPLQMEIMLPTSM